MRVLCFSLMAVYLSWACTAKENERDRRQQGRRDFQPPSVERFDPRELQPTQPQGGIVDGRLERLEPSESLRRKLANEQRPIIFGESAAGIGMDTSFEAAHEILASPVGTFSGQEFFPEDIRISWNQSEPRLPNFIVIGSNYKGPLQMPNLDIQLFMGELISERFPLGTVDEQNSAMKTIGAWLDGEDPATYDCIVERRCRLDQSESSLIFDFAKGGFLLDPADGSLDLMFFVPTRQLFPFLTAPLIYGVSLGGITPTTTKQDAEANILGPPVFINAENGLHYYDDFNFVVSWGADDLPEEVAALDSYRGGVPIPGEDTTRTIGQSFADLIPTDVEASPEELARRLHMLFESADEDCIALETCSILTRGSNFQISLNQAFFIFSNSADFKLEIFGY